MEKNTIDAHKQSTDPKPWKGYPVADLRYQQAYTAASTQLDRQ